MIQNNKINNLLNVLKTDIDDLLLLHRSTLKDPYIEAGFEYEKKYPYTPEHIKNFNEKVAEQERLIQLEAQKLYGKIVNFTQTYYSIKECLAGTFTKAKYPSKNTLIKHYFSEEKIDGITRIEICNGLKHDPTKDLHYKQNFLKETRSTSRQIVYSITNLGKTWFYDNKDTVKLCKFLYEDLQIFLEKLKNKNGL